VFSNFGNGWFPCRPPGVKYPDDVVEPKRKKKKWSATKNLADLIDETSPIVPAPAQPTELEPPSEAPPVGEV